MTILAEDTLELTILSEKHSTSADFRYQGLKSLPKTLPNSPYIWNPSCHPIRTAKVRSRWPTLPSAKSVATNQQYASYFCTSLALTQVISPPKNRAVSTKWLP